MSHAPGINKVYSEDFIKMCLGNGPIRNTIGNLQTDYDEDLWQLFCSELDDYLQVESIEGGPYRRITDIKATSSSDFYRVGMVFRFFIIGGLNPGCDYMNLNDDLSYNLIRDFTRYLLKSGGLPVEFVSNDYSVGMSYIDCTIYISNMFIAWFNREDNPYRKCFSLQTLLSNRILGHYIIKNGELLLVDKQRSDRKNVLDYERNKICTFKGREILRHIMEKQEQPDPSYLLFLRSEIIKPIVGTIIKVVNYKYGRTENTHSEFGGKTFYL